MKKTASKRAKTNHSEIVFYRTNIPTLDELLGGPQSSRIASKTASTQEGQGIAYYKEIGFFGVVFGAAGSGKSILGIELCCRFLWPTQSVRDCGKRRAIYVCQEEPGLIEEKIKAFGFAAGTTQIHRYGTVKRSVRKGGASHNGNGFGSPGLHIIRMPLEEGKQQAILENIFNAVAQAIGSEKNASGAIEVLVCVDNAETIADHALLAVTGAGSQGLPTPEAYGARNRDDRNFFKLVRLHCARHGISSFFIYEEKVREGYEAERRDLATTAQAYAADIAIRLSLHEFPAGYKERSLEIIKAKNQYYRRGRHHFSIVGSANGTKSCDTGIVIYPSMATQLHICRGRLMERASGGAAAGGDGCLLGIRDVDATVSRMFEKRKMGYLHPGTVSVLVSDLDVRANNIALHFAFQEDSKQSPNPLYLSLVHQESTLQRELRRFRLANNCPRGFESFHYFPPEHISEGKLLRDIAALIGDNARGRRVVVDNLFGLRARWPLVEDADHFIATLFTLFRERQVVAFVVDMVEVGEGRNPIGDSFAAGLADNVFTLRHVELHSKAHTVFSALKLFGQRTPHYLWDLMEEHSEETTTLRAHDTFAFYKNVLSGKPEPVRITMSLHADCEESPLDDFLRDKLLALTKPSGRIVDLHRYERHQYTHNQNSLTLASTHPLSDCHIVSVDETWIEHFLQNDLLEEIDQYLKLEEFNRSLYSDRTAYVTAGQDLAFTYRAEEKKGTSEEKDYKNWYLVPDRNNCGVLCLDEQPWGYVRQDDKARRIVKDVLGVFPGDIHAWAEGKVKRQKLRWTQIAKLQRGLRERGLKVFTFCMDQLESSVSFLLELALSSSRTSIVNADRMVDFRSPAWRRALLLMLSLLDDMEIQILASGRYRSTKDEPRSLFSRQWFSTWGTLRKFVKGPPPKIAVTELPLGEGKQYPTPVSGAWYLGILKGSFAVRAGVQVIKQFTSDEDNLFKVNAGIGLPVRKAWYARPRSPDVLVPLPYRKQFLKIAACQKKPWARSVKDYKRNILCGEFPFYRTRIKYYGAVAPIIFGMMVEAAREHLRGKRPMKSVIKHLANAAQTRYEQIYKLREAARPN
jgi:hypothetical protein